jgi:hypothetical protein
LNAHSGPPLAPFVLNVGITGHRSHSLGPDAGDALTRRLTDNLRLIEQAGRKVLADSPDLFADGPPRFRLISPLADGADQAAAEAALLLGWELQAILPFDRARYRASLEHDEARAAFDDLVARASVVLELPGDGDGEVGDYVMTGRTAMS